MTARRCRIPVLLAAALVAAGGRPAGAQPSVACRADTGGQRVLVRVSLADLFDEELLRLVRLGLVGRLSLKATLFRQRYIWFDARLVEASRELSVSWSREEETFTVQGRPVEHPNRLEVPEITLSLAEDPDALARAYVEVSARLEVITASSLGQVARWLVRGNGPERAEAAPQVVPGALVKYLAADLARKTTGRCPLRRRGRSAR